MKNGLHMKSKFSRKGKVSTVAQILSLILSTIAFAYLLGSTFPVVSAVDQCIKSSSGQEFKVGDLSTQAKINQWCTDNGRSSVCDGGSNSWKLKTSLIHPCPSQTPTPPTLSQIPVSPQKPSGPSTQPEVPAAQGPSPQELGCIGNADCGAKDAINIAALKDVKWILKTAAWAATIYYGTKWVLNQLGVNPELAGAISNSVTVYYIATQILTKIGVKGTLSVIGLTLPIVPVIGIVISIITFFFTYHKTRYDLYQFTCYPWDAPLGGKDCEKCNQGDFPCTEYRCRSLGQACELENQGTGQELCVWKNRNDAKPPVIQPWTETLTTGYKYIPDNAISPPDRGVKIVPESDNNGCVAPFIPLRFGITLDEPAKCKIDPSNKKSFDDMDFYFNGSSTSKYNHSQTMSLPSLQALEAENITLVNDGEFALYARCQDANGNENTGNFAFKFCIDKGPDTTPPLVVTTSILNGFPISFGTTSVNLDVFVNEPSDCKWSQTDQSYDNMETPMSCNKNVLEVNAQSLYKCSTTLNGLNDAVDNNFYFRCKDQPSLEGTNTSSQRNANSQSYKFTLVGTRPLVIDSVKPNGAISDSTDVIKVTLEAKTSAGFKEGDALCYFSDTGEEGSYVQFFKTGTYQHSQDLFLAEGDYTYYIRCIDLGGNTDNKQTSFRVESDSEAPVVVRTFKEENFLKIITDENASCVYSTSTQTACNYLFEDGIKMQSLENNKHQVAWNPDRTFYIKCQDEFKNQPLPNECSIIASPFGK